MSDNEVQPALAGVSNARSDLGDMNILSASDLRGESPHLTGILPFGSGFRAEAPAAGLSAGLEAPEGPPPALNELGQLRVSTYDLSTTQAGQLGIPIIGSGGAGASRRVVILEWARFKDMPQADGSNLRFGYAIRFCLTVNKWNANMKISLPFLSAQAELGAIEASWMLDVNGLAGPKINAAAIPPKQLNVETFVLAQQSIEKLIAAAEDPTTQFIAGTIIARTEPGSPEVRLRRAAVQTFALSSILRGRQEAKALPALSTPTAEDMDALHDTYVELGIMGVGDIPVQQQRDRARAILNGIEADV